MNSGREEELSDFILDNVLKIMTDRRRPTAIKPLPGRLSSILPSSSSPPSPINPVTLNQQFADLIRHNKDYCQHIQRILKETDKSYNEINDTHVLTSGRKKIFVKKYLIYSF
jgi:hypothetical protein